MRSSIFCFLMFATMICLNAQISIRTVAHAITHWSNVEVFGGPSSVSETVTGTTPFKPGYIFGTGVSYSVSHFDFSLRLAFEKKGTKQQFDFVASPDSFNNPPTYNDPPITANARIDDNLDYYSLTVLPKFVFGKNRVFKIGAGVYLASLQKRATTEMDYVNGTLMRTVFAENHFYIEKYDYGLSFFASCNILQKDKWGVNLSLIDNYGLRDLAQHYNPHPVLKNNTFSVMIGVSYKK